MTDSTPDTQKPDWWVTNERLRAELGLPPYEPPRFDDGVPTHEVTEDIAAEYSCKIRFKGIDTRYPDDFVVYVDGAPAFSVGRHRDDNGNTVYQISSTRFRERIEQRLQ